MSDATSTVPAGGTHTWSITNNTTGATVLISDVNAANPSITLQGFGTATLTQTITNPATGAGCTGATDSVVFTLDQNPVITIEDVACNAAAGGTTLQLTAVVSAGGGPGTTFSWVGWHHSAIKKLARLLLALNRMMQSLIVGSMLLLNTPSHGPNLPFEIAEKIHNPALRNWQRPPL